MCKISVAWRAAAIKVAGLAAIKVAGLAAIKAAGPAAGAACESLNLECCECLSRRETMISMCFGVYKIVEQEVSTKRQEIIKKNYVMTNIPLFSVNT